MITKPDFDLISLDWASRTMGAKLNLGNVSSEIVKRFKKEIPFKHVRLFLWDNTKRKLLLAASTAKAPASGNFSATNEMFQAIASKEPLFVKSKVLIPLKRGEYSAGLIELSEKKLFLKNKEKVLELAGFIGLSLANTKLFME
jgi:hypothetical protein